MELFKNKLQERKMTLTRKPIRMYPQNLLNLAQENR